MPYISIADELDEEEVKLAAKNCSSSYVGHTLLSNYTNGQAKFVHFSENKKTLESLCLVAYFKLEENKKITVIELKTPPKNTLQLKLKYGENFLGEVSESCLIGKPEQNSILYLSDDLRNICKLRSLEIPYETSKKLDDIAFELNDPAVQKLTYAVSHPLMNWEDFIDNAIERLSNKAKLISFYKD